MAPARPSGLLLMEWAFVIPIAMGLAYSAWYLSNYGYLPQPYFYEPYGTYMDFFSVAQYAHQEGAFDVFGSIYPPLSYVLLRWLSWAPCYLDNGAVEARSCDFVGIASLYLIFAINAVLIYLSFRKIDRRTAIPRSFALALGLPMTYTLERGNLLLFCFTCILLAYGPLLRSARLRWVFAGLAVNFKIYLVGTLFAQLLRRRWLWFEGALIATIVIYLVSFAIYGDGSPWQIYDNIALFAGGYKASTLLDLWYTNSLIPLRTLLEGDAQFPIVAAVGSSYVAIGLIAVKTIIIVTVASVVVASAATMWRPAAVPTFRVVYLSIAMAMATSELGGYTQIFTVFFVFMEAWRGIGRRLAIIMAYVLCIPLDVPLQFAAELYRESFLSGGPVVTQYWLSLGVFVRPVLLYLIAIALAMVTIRDVWAHAHTQPRRWPFVSGCLGFNSGAATSFH